YYVFFYISLTIFLFFFFFSSRRRHTRCYRDWSSDVCSSDLHGLKLINMLGKASRPDFCFDLHEKKFYLEAVSASPGNKPELNVRSEERRVGKECRSRG